MASSTRTERAPTGKKIRENPEHQCSTQELEYTDQRSARLQKSTTFRHGRFAREYQQRVLSDIKKRVRRDEEMA